ncbi:MAG TPA: efflux RND transporter permease subunit, partial [Burkholderiales bacterium]|nr:efflux RND transporter permease subunit [Burkholderiales bacterium]
IANTNTVAIIEEVERRLAEEIIPALPPGMTITVASNDALLIQEIVNALKEHLIEGTMLAALVVWIFLRSVRSTLIISLAIPVSLLGSVAVMYFAGYTFNALTLLALLLLIGVVVDDAIVVLENIFRHREHIDPNPMSAAVNGTREVVFAVVAATLSLVAIFAPVIFLSGIIGKFFRSFAVVVTCGVLVSMFVSLTLTPMLCSRYLKVEKRHGRIYHLFDRFFTGMDRGYRALLKLALAHRWWVVLLTLIVVASSGYFFGRIGKTFVPEEDESRFMVFLKTPLGASIDYTDSRLREVERVLAGHNEVTTYFTAIGLGQAGQVNRGLAFVRMVPREERAIKQQEFLNQLRTELAQIPGVQAFATLPAIVGGQRGEPLQFVLKGPNLQEVGRLAEELRTRLSDEPGLGRLDLDLQLDLPQLELEVDRTRAASLGIASGDVAQALNMFTGGIDVALFNDIPGDGERYDVRVKAIEGALAQLSDLSRVYLRSRDGKMVRLDSVAHFKQSLGPAVIGRFDLQYAANFYGSPTIPLGTAVDKIYQEASEFLPLGYSIKLVGQTEEFTKTVNYMIFAFALATILLFMVLASQFDSFVQPFIVMLAQPLAIVGGVFALWLTGHTLNIYSMIGLVLLIGLVAKNSILLVDLTNQRRAQGLPVDEALRDACPIRLRPVLMTSFTIILALLPAALGFGAGAETNGPLSVAVIGGMVSSTLLTLVVVPAVYSLIENGLLRFRARSRVKQRSEQAAD